MTQSDEEESYYFLSCNNLLTDVPDAVKDVAGTFLSILWSVGKLDF